MTAPNPPSPPLSVQVMQSLGEREPADPNAETTYCVTAADLERTIESCAETIEWELTTLRTRAASLEARCGDLEMMLRATKNPGSTSCLYYNPTRNLNPVRRERWCLNVPEGDGSYHRLFLADDGTGLPLLTPEARIALSGEGKEK